jgi:flagellar biosynthesis/type III secretory pathway protein FliH
MSANQMIRPFIPPAIAALRPFMLLKSSVADSAEDPNPASDAGFIEGHACGLREGRLAGQRESEARAREAFDAERAILVEKLAKLEAVESVSAAFDRLLATRDTTERALEDAARSVLVSALRTLFPVLLASAAGAELSALIGEALAVRAPGTLVLRANPGTLACLASAAPDGLALTADPSLDPGAAELSWSGGGLSFDPAALLQRITTLLSPAPRENKDTLP